MKPDAIDERFVPTPRRCVASVEVEGEVVLLDEETGSLHLLNPIGSVVFQCLDGTVDVGALTEELAEVFDAPLDLVREDVLRLVRELGAGGLLEGVEATEEVP